MKKRFILVEVLAITLILGTIALIALPQVTDVIKNGKVKSLKKIVNEISKSAELYATQHQDNQEKRFDIINGEIVTIEQDVLNYNGNIESGVIIIKPDSKILVCISDGKNSAYKSANNSKVTIFMGKICNIPRNDTTEIVLEDNIIEEDESYNTLNDLINDSTVEVGNTVETKGFYSSNDGGGAYYNIVDDQSLVVDGYSIIALNNGLKAQLVINEKMSLKQYGAVGDGKTDNTNIINLALKKSKNHTLYVPEGTYIISGSIKPQSNTIIIGEGKKSLFKAKGGMKVSSELFMTRGVNNIIFKKIAVSGNIIENPKENGHSAMDGIHIFDIWNSSNISIEESYFIDNVYAAIRIVGGNKISVRNSNFLTVDCGIITLGSPDNSDLLIENNLFDGHDNSEPISIYGNGKTTNLTIKNNTIRNKKYATAIFIGSGTIENIKIENNNITSVATGIVLKANNAVIKNNSINNSELETGGYGIQINNSSNVIVSSNNLTGIWLDGMRINNSSNIDITNNTIKDSGRSNKDFVFVRFADSDNVDVKFHNNNIIREDTSLNKYLIFGYGTQNTQIINNKLVNGEIYLWPNSSNYTVKNNNVNIINKGTNNIVE